MKTTFFCLLAVLTLQAHAARPMAYPKSPDPQLTPGSLCDQPDSYRHPEQIPYCERGVNSFLKEAIFIAYRKELGYRLNGDRDTYKIDHFIPLCAGGSNHQNNLWPQHVSISKITDDLESFGCEKLSKEQITQKELIELIMRAKLNLEEAPQVMKFLRKLR